jgi:GDP-L-fucose synthase
VIGFEGRFEHDLSKPDGTPRKLMSGDKIRALGWRPGISLRDGLAETYRAFLGSRADVALDPASQRSGTGL